MHKPILQWDRSQCSEMICTCHDDSSAPRFCSGCGCNVASPGHRNTAERRAAAIQAARDLWADCSSDELEIDDDPEVSDGECDEPPEERGAFVQAWIWIHPDEINARLPQAESKVQP